MGLIGVSMWLIEVVNLFTKSRLPSKYDGLHIIPYTAPHM